MGDGYAPGTIRNNRYVNEWAGIALSFPAGYTEAGPEYYATFETDNGITDCDLYLLSEQQEMLAVIYIDISEEPEATAEAYAEQMADTTGRVYEQLGYNITHGQYNDPVIRSGFATSFLVIQGGGIKMRQTFSCEKIDDHLCMIIILDVDEQMVPYDLLQLFEAL